MRILDREREGSLIYISGFLIKEELFWEDIFYLEALFRLEFRKALWFLGDYWYLRKPNDINIFIVNQLNIIHQLYKFNLYLWNIFNLRNYKINEYKLNNYKINQLCNRKPLRLNQLGLSPSIKKLKVPIILYPRIISQSIGYRMALPKS